MSKLSVRRHLYESMKNIYMKMITTTAMMISLLFVREVVEHKWEIFRAGWKQGN